MAALRALLGLLVSAAAWASEPPTAPQLRIETGAHAAMARRVVVDSTRQRLFTAGDDKTVRVWQLPRGRLIQTLRLPLGPRQEGRPYAVAVAPDGQTVYVAGWTGLDWDRAASVYAFDVTSGELKARIGRFADSVSTLNVSPDGQTLAVGVNGPGGLHLHRLPGGERLAQDPQYNDRVMAADYSAQGRLAVVALDGYMRVYDASGRLIGRKGLGAGAQPAGVRFSPDGARLAVSFRNRPFGQVLSGRDLTVLGDTAPGLPPQAVQAQVAWSSDGATLYITGDSGRSGEGVIWSWSEGGLGPLRSWPVARGRVADIAQMPQGQLAFATEDPVIGVMAPDGQVRRVSGPSVLDFRGSAQALRVSGDGATVEFPHTEGLARFHLPGRQLDVIAGAAHQLPESRRGAAGLALTGTVDTEAPQLHGRPLALEPYETSRSHVVAPDGGAFALGTEWSVRGYGADGQARWVTPVSSPAWNLAYSGDGRWLVAALGDGTLRWLRASDGQEVVAAFVHAESREWIAWLPSGHYLSSDHGDNFVGWALNRGRERAADFYRAVQFERVLFRPDLVLAAFASQGASPREGTAGSGVFSVQDLARIAPPSISLQATPGGGVAALTIEARADGLPMESFAVYVNSIPVLALEERRMDSADRDRLRRRFEIPLPEAENLVRVEVLNGRSMGLREIWLDSPDRTAAPQRAAGDLYLVAVGVNEFPKLAGVDLAYAARDAQQVAERMAREAGRLFRKVHLKVLHDQGESPTRAAILRALETVKAARAQDTVLIFLASHGISSPDGTYYFVPRDATAADVARVDKEPMARAESLIDWTQFSDVLRQVPGRRLLIVDTCHSGRMAGTADLHALSKRSAASLFSLVTASKGEEFSQEYEPGRHGLFTFAMLQALQAAEADRNRDGVISLEEMFTQAVPTVQRLRDRASPQNPQQSVPAPLRSLALASLPSALPGASLGAPNPTATLKTSGFAD